MKKKALFLVFVFLLLSLPSEAVKLVTWNLLNFPGSTGVAREDDFRLVINKIAPDILATQEMIGLAGVNQFLTKVMNFSVPEKYAAAPFFDGPDTNNALFYRKSTITYLGKTQIQTDLRDITEYRLKVKAGPGVGTIFRVYSMHLKSGDSSTERNQRAEEAKKLRNRLNSLPTSTLALACGDLNLYKSSEIAYQYLTNHDAPYSARLNDPVQKPGDWHDGSQFALLHTQSASTTQKGGRASGGLDDRFDFILISDPMLTSTQLGYVKGSYTAYGNDGKHFNKAVNDGTNYAVGKAQADALWESSDHLPVIVQLLPQSGGIPKAPSGLSASSTSSSQVQLSWNDNSNNEKGFKIEQKSTGDWSQSSTAPANAEVCYIGGLSSAYTYSFRVRAYNADGNSGYSNEAARKPGEDITVYITNTGTKYHRDGCQYLASSKIAINLLDAKAQGYTPCSVCNPPTMHR
ncbi:MAG: fibronectin type III domain-containing protein [Candidatus Aminicenantes bacterium]|nr:fibronectin type III domain-containing protein [Candidatus Aminicenantes bacterium]